jgi:flagellar biosynthesis anti-sigma factor FlgM
MKILTYQPTAIAPAAKADASRVAERLERGTVADGVSLSPDARWVSAIKEEARQEPAVRGDLVEKTRAAIANGTFESSVDLDRLVDQLLAEL